MPANHLSKIPLAVHDAEDVQGPWRYTVVSRHGEPTVLGILRDGATWQIWLDDDHDGRRSQLEVHKHRLSALGRTRVGIRSSEGDLQVLLLLGRKGQAVWQRRWTRKGVWDVQGTGHAVRVRSFDRSFPSEAVEIGVDLDENGVLDPYAYPAEWGTIGTTLPFGHNGVRLDFDAGTVVVLTHPTAPPPPEEAPEFSLTSLDASELTSIDATGRWTLLDFWGTWCGPCIDDEPELQALHSRWEEHLRIIGIAVDTEERVRRHLLRSPATWPNAVVDRQAEILGDYSISFFPTYVLIDDKGKIRARGGLPAIADALERAWLSGG